MTNTNRTNIGNSRPARLSRPWLLAVALAFVIPACAPDADDTADGDLDTGDPMAETEREIDRDRDAYGDPMTRETAADRDVQLSIQQSETFGEYIASSDGRPLYLFTADVQGESSACYDACAEAWPPVTGTPTATSGLDESLLGTITRDDGSIQTTYNGWPLYEFVRDSGNEPTGQDVEGHGGEWYLVSPDGEQVNTN